MAEQIPFNTRNDLYDTLDKIVKWVSSDVVVAGDLLPRFGLLGAILRKTPVHIYDHPEVLQMCNTAFTDGLAVFIAAPYLEELIAEQRAGFDSGVGILLHECGHILRHHSRRLLSFPPQIRNVAADIRIDLDTMHGFPNLKFGPKAYWLCGLDKDETEQKYGVLSEETIAQMLLSDPAMKPKTGSMAQLLESIKQDLEQIKNQSGAQQDLKNSAANMDAAIDQNDGQKMAEAGSKLQQSLCNQPKNDSGKGQSAPKPGAGGQPGSGAGNDDPNANPFDGMPLGAKLEALQQALKAGAQMANANVGEGINHISSPEALAQMLEQAGLKAVAGKLGIEAPEAREAQKAAQAMKITDAVRQAATQKQRHGDKYPGGHIVDGAVEMIDGFAKPQLTWQARLRDLIEGDGMHVDRSMAMPSALYYVDPSVTGLNMQAYLPSYIPAKPSAKVVFIVDSSASVERELAKKLLSEVLGFASNQTEFSPDLMVVSADTVVRGEPEFINEYNVEEFLSKGFNLKGRGGTSFIEPIRAAVAMAKQKALNDGDWRDTPVLVVYATDFECSVPAVADLPEGLSGLCFIGPQGSHHETFARQLDESMMAIAIAPDVTIDLAHLEALAEEREPARRGARP